MVRILALLLATLGTASAVQYEAKPGQWTWNVCTSAPYKALYPNWLDCRAEVARLNGLENTDEAFRTLDPGTKFLEYPDPVNIDERIRKAVERIKIEKDAAIAQLEGDVARLKRQAALADERLAAAMAYSWFWDWRTLLLLLLFLLALASAIGAALALSRRRGTVATADNSRFGKLDDENRALATQVAELEERNRTLAADNRELAAALDSVAYRFDLPADIVPQTGNSRYVYLPRGPLDGAEETVYVYGTDRPVYAKNVLRKFNEVDDAVLSHYGLRRDLTITRRTRVHT